VVVILYFEVLMFGLLSRINFPITLCLRRRICLEERLKFAQAPGIAERFTVKLYQYDGHREKHAKFAWACD